MISIKVEATVAVISDSEGIAQRRAAANVDKGVGQRLAVEVVAVDDGRTAGWPERTHTLGPRQYRGPLQDGMTTTSSFGGHWKKNGDRKRGNTGVTPPRATPAWNALVRADIAASSALRSSVIVPLRQPVGHHQENSFPPGQTHSDGVSTVQGQENNEHPM